MRPTQRVAWLVDRVSLWTLVAVVIGCAIGTGLYFGSRCGPVREWWGGP